MSIGNIINKLLSNFGYALKLRYHHDLSQQDINTFNTVSNLTMTPEDRVFALIECVRYLSKSKINGSIVECGVWRGGSVIAAIKVLLEQGDSSRNIYLFDTYEGMVEPTKDDVSFNGQFAKDTYINHISTETKNGSTWCYSSLDDVKSNVYKTGYPKEKLIFIKGKVEDTINEATITEDIALLRLDTDWYESTSHELKFLFPRLVKGGVLVIDDYGDWQGSRKAVDEYLTRNNIKMLLVRLSSGCRIGVKI